MFTSGHLTSGLALALALDLRGAPLLVLVGASVLVDWDYPLGRLVGRNHRHLLTHSPPVVAFALALAALVVPLAWFALLGAMLHLALDMTDYGVRLNPFSARIVGLRALRVATDASFREYLRAYFRDPRFLGAELALLALVIALAAGKA